MALDYFTVRTIHMTAVALSFTGFVVRGLGGLRGAAWVRGRAARTWPHVVDTVLLLSAITLVALLQPSLSGSGWLLAKIAGLVAYVGLGTVALKPGRPRAVRATAFVAALLVFGWIVSVAITKSPAGLFSRL
jgi:uncharacterized membrane protein SirB2